jgi:tetratricopeptide (TPR) repeat protein
MTAAGTASVPANAAPQPSASPDAFALASDALARRRPLRQQALVRASHLIGARQMAPAHLELSTFLAQHPDDADALSLMARLQVQLGRRADAIAWLERCLAQAPDFAAARFNLAHLLFQSHQLTAARAQLERLLVGDDVAHPLFLQLKANVLEAMGDVGAALTLCEALATAHPTRAACWIRLGHALRASGRATQAIDAYRQAIACQPDSGVAWWGLAGLKTYRFEPADLQTMAAKLADANTPAEDRHALQFALAKGCEDAGDHAQAFALWEAANTALRQRIQYDPNTLSAGVATNKTLFTPAFFAQRAGSGCQAPDPIFVLGRPRSGSTLVEQILASHPAIEGTSELPYLPDLAARLNPQPGPAFGSDYLRALAQLDPMQLKRLGDEYLERAAVHRQSDRPLFIDKNPANFAHIGLIQLILPQAKIIDVRRHPAACCLSIFKLYSAKGRLQLPELGRFYRDYVQLMAHFDAVLPGRVYRLHYEALVAQPEAEVRSLLAHLGLAFDPACLRFYETERSVRTPSSEQVRRPLTRDAVDHWRQYEAQLGPLIDSLGSVYSAYPEVPGELR